VGVMRCCVMRSVPGYLMTALIFCETGQKMKHASIKVQGGLHGIFVSKQ